MSADLQAQQYDRQLRYAFVLTGACMNSKELIAVVDRLWGEHGQQELETASVCLINATAAGTETLKNLVLPGTSAAASSYSADAVC